MEERNGHMIWGAWVFDYVVSGTEGLSLVNGFFRGRSVFSKLSLPVIRVKYTQDEDFWHNPTFKNGCGPYNDRITWDPADFGEDLLNSVRGGPHHLMTMRDCGDRYICIRSRILADGKSWLELGVYARIGAYHIYQSWYLNDEGIILPRVFSKGLSCNLDHWHHPYWRFDFDLDGSSNQRVNIFNGSQFFGFVNQEGRFLNSSIGDARYNVQNLRTGLKAWVTPPALDAERGIVGPTSFSELDVFVQKYRPEEDRNWSFAENQDIGFQMRENPDGGDVVFWSICHLLHHEDEGKDHWHEVGPEIKFELPEPVASRPEDCRTVKIRGHIHVKDFKLVGHDKWGHYDFDETLKVDPNSPHAEVLIRRDRGDVTADLIFRINWRADRSVAVNFTAELYDEGQRVSSLGNDFNVLRDSSIDWGGVHLVDYHGGDPDTADMDFTVSNNQCPSWQRFELAPAGLASGNGGIAAVSRIPISMEIWWIGADGSIQDAFWYEGQPSWGRQQLAPARSASVNSGIAAVSRVPGSMEVWWIGADGSVQDAFWYEGQPWKRLEVAPPGTASLNGGITAVSRIPNSMEIWWIGTNGSIQDAFWYEGQDGWRRFELAPLGSASPNGGITAVSRIPNSMEIWWIGTDGSVQNAFWYEGQRLWGRQQVAPAGSASVNSGIAAVSRVPGSMEVWWIGADGSVQDAFWYEGQPWKRFEVAPAGSASVNSGIAAVSRVPGSMEIWWAGANGSVQDAFWYEGQDGWRRFELTPPGSASNNGGITGVSRIPNSLEVWWIGANGSIQDAFWYS